MCYGGGSRFFPCPYQDWEFKEDKVWIVSSQCYPDTTLGTGWPIAQSMSSQPWQPEPDSVQATLRASADIRGGNSRLGTELMNSGLASMGHMHRQK